MRNSKVTAARLVACLIVATVLVHAEEPKSKPPTEERKAQLRAEVDRYFGLSEESDQERLESSLSKIQGFASDKQTSSDERYVFLSKIREIGLQIGNVKAFRESIDAQLRYFEGDPWLAYSNSSMGLPAFARAHPDEFTKSLLIEESVELARRRADEGDPQAALDFIGQLGTAITKAGNASAKFEVLKLVHRQLAYRVEVRRRYVEAKKLLEEDPADSKANFACGEYTLVEGQDWKAALAAFMKCDDDDFAGAAQIELEGQDPEVVGDAWLEVAVNYRESNRLRDAVIDHAVTWLEEAGANATPFKKETLDTKISELKKLRSAEPSSVLQKSPGMAEVTSAATSKPAVRESRETLRIKAVREKAAPDAVKIGEHYYFVVRANVPWDVAQKKCRDVGGYLACLESAEEQRQVVASIKGSSVLWLGGLRMDSGKFAWLTGDPITQKIEETRRPFRFIALTKSGNLNVRPQTGTVPAYPAKKIAGYICEWEH